MHSGIYQDVKNEEDFLVVEEWAIQKDSYDHLRSDIFAIILALLVLCASRRKL